MHPEVWANNSTAEKGPIVSVLMDASKHCEEVFQQRCVWVYLHSISVHGLVEDVKKVVATAEKVLREEDGKDGDEGNLRRPVENEKGKEHGECLKEHPQSSGKATFQNRLNQRRTQFKVRHGSELR